MSLKGKCLFLYDLDDEPMEWDNSTSADQSLLKMPLMDAEHWQLPNLSPPGRTSPNSRSPSSDSPFSLFKVRKKAIKKCDNVEGSSKGTPTFKRKALATVSINQMEAEHWQLPNLSPPGRTSPHSKSPSLESSFSLFKIRKKAFSKRDSIEGSTKETVSPTLKRKALATISVNQGRPSTHLTCQSPGSIQAAVQNSLQNPNLIGDFSKDCSLPTVYGRNLDLKSISCSTVAGMLTNACTHNCMIIDCRYPYEYDGGHIKGARNIYLTEVVTKELFHDGLSSSQNTIIIFYCEYSSRRAPDMYRFVRNKDRELNVEQYPCLFYPEIYIIEGGYRAFYRDFKNFCEPQGYVSMLDKDSGSKRALYTTECRTLRKKMRRSTTRLRTGLKF